MKKFFTCISLLIFLCVNIAFSSNGLNGKKSKTSLSDAPHKSGRLVFKVKTEYKSSCTSNEINLPSLINAFSEIGATDISKKFPLSPASTETVNKYGKKLVDLSLIYQVIFSPVIKIEEVMKIILATGVVEYAEPLFIHQLDFTPNDPSIASQYALGKINAYLAWDVWTGDTNVVVGIVDSGTDWDHPDLVNSIKYNYADPVDGLDNDNDGFADNFRGWDVSENDNNPMVGNQSHGSHVSGCATATTNNAIGVAAPGYNCKFLPVKSSNDASINSIDNGYDGIVYAADHGADVINCSWGGGFDSQFEQDIINYATYNQDALVIAAAGNGAVEESHYPASYENVISVAATGNSDLKANFSSFGSDVDVSAPGDNIYSTIHNNSYASLDGTSMSSPIAAGCAAMIKSRFPSLNALQVGAQLRSTCDNIYNLSGNSTFIGKLGKGRVNLLKGVTDSLSPGVIMRRSFLSDNNDEVFIAGDTLDIVGLFENLLRPTSNLTCSLTTTNTFVQILQANFNPGVMATFDTISNYAAEYRVLIKPTAPLNTEVTLKVTLTDGTWSDIYTIVVTVNVDYVNVAVNDVATSITSKSTIGYNQPSQVQGIGFTYQSGASILYDMGLMIGAQGTQVSDNVRGDSGDDADFASFIKVSAQQPGTISDIDVNGVFKDNGATSFGTLNLTVNHRAYAWNPVPDSKYIMVQYYIKNNGISALTNLFAALFADWDVMDYTRNKCSTDILRRMGYIWNTDVGGVYAGIKVLSHTGGFNHYALDNTTGNSGIEMTDGFSNSEKYTAMTTARADAGTASVPGNDVLSTVSTGPFNLAPGDSIEVAFALIAGESLSSIQISADAAQTKYDNMFVGILPIGNADRNELYQNFPNPADKESRIEFSLKENNSTELSIYNILGKKVKTVFNEKMSAGRYSIVVSVSDLPTGNYLYKLVSGTFSKTLPISVIH